MLGSAESQVSKLIIREIIFEEFQRVWSQSTNVTDRRTNRQTDRQTTYHGNTALRYASRGKKLWTDFDEISWRGRAWPRDQRVQFWWRSGSPSGSRSPKSEIRIHWIIELLTDFDEILWRSGVWPRDQLITFWWRSGSESPFPFVDPGRIATVLLCWRLVEVCALWVYFYSS